jgi:hypothetical protein
VKKIIATGWLLLALLMGARVIEAKTVKSAKASANKVVVYYIHGHARCSNCIRIEAYAKEAVESGFVKELKSGRVEWKVVDYEDQGNKHFFTDYKLFTKSVVVSDVKKGKEIRFKNLEKVWQHLGDKAAFMAYVQAEVKAYLGEKK